MMSRTPHWLIRAVALLLVPCLITSFVPTSFAQTSFIRTSFVQTASIQEQAIVQSTWSATRIERVKTATIYAMVSAQNPALPDSASWRSIPWGVWVSVLVIVSLTLIPLFHALNASHEETESGGAVKQVPPSEPKGPRVITLEDIQRVIGLLDDQLGLSPTAKDLVKNWILGNTPLETAEADLPMMIRTDGSKMMHEAEARAWLVAALIAAKYAFDADNFLDLKKYLGDIDNVGQQVEIKYLSSHHPHLDGRYLTEKMSLDILNEAKYIFEAGIQPDSFRPLRGSGFNNVILILGVVGTLAAAALFAHAHPAVLFASFILPRSVVLIGAPEKPAPAPSITESLGLKSWKDWKERLTEERNVLVVRDESLFTLDTLLTLEMAEKTFKKHVFTMGWPRDLNRLPEIHATLVQISKLKAADRVSIQGVGEVSVTELARRVARFDAVYDAPNAVWVRYDGYRERPGLAASVRRALHFVMGPAKLAWFIAEPGLQYDPTNLKIGLSVIGFLALNFWTESLLRSLYLVAGAAYLVHAWKRHRRRVIRMERDMEMDMETEMEGPAPPSQKLLSAAPKKAAKLTSREFTKLLSTFIGSRSRPLEMEIQKALEAKPTLMPYLITYLTDKGIARLTVERLIVIAQNAIEAQPKFKLTRDSARMLVNPRNTPEINRLIQLRVTGRLKKIRPAIFKGLISATPVRIKKDKIKPQQPSTPLLWKTHLYHESSHIEGFVDGSLSVYKNFILWKGTWVHGKQLGDPDAHVLHTGA